MMFTIGSVNFEPESQGPDHFAAWQCRLCRWNGRTTFRTSEEHVQEDARRVAEQHGYGRCVP